MFVSMYYIQSDWRFITILMFITILECLRFLNGFQGFYTIFYSKIHNFKMGL
jgi:hypothetical protein